MELIPILSTIILVATISTFILAVGAYLLYKIREGRPVEVVRKKQFQEAELIEPDQGNNGGTRTEVTVEHQKPVHKVDYTSKQVEVQSSGSGYKSKVISHENIKDQIKVELPASKFSKYTREGLIAPDEEKSEKVMKWR